jgi:hypothetical protein
MCRRTRRLPRPTPEVREQREAPPTATANRNGGSNQRGRDVRRAGVELDRGSGYRIEHFPAGIDEIVQIFNLHREVRSNGIFDAAGCPDMGKYARARRGARSGVKEPWPCQSRRIWNRRSRSPRPRPCCRARRRGRRRDVVLGCAGVGADNRP